HNVDIGLQVRSRRPRRQGLCAETAGGSNTSTKNDTEPPMTTPTPHEVKLALERMTMEQGVTIIGLHSVLMADETTLSAIFDIATDVAGCGLNFTFLLPQLVSRKDLNEFALWLASPDYSGGITMH